jgi:hypothetical protein
MEQKMTAELKITIDLSKKDWKELDHYIKEKDYIVSRIKKDGRKRYYFLKRKE